MYVFKSTNVTTICHFCEAHNIMNFVLNYYMLVGYIIDYVQIFFIFF
jgi:hypothetical protein